MPKPPLGAGPAWVAQTQTPDYHLTPATPVWAQVHWCPAPSNPLISIHGGVEVGIVTAGEEEILLQGEPIRARAGDVWLCAISEPHRFRIVEPNTVNLVVVFLPSFLGEEMLGDIPWLTLFAVPASRRPRVTTAAGRATILDIACRLKEEIEQRGPRWECAVRLELLRLLFHLSRGWTPPRGEEEGAGASGGSLSRIMPALALVHERAVEGVSRMEAAEVCGLGRSRFTTLFRETMGVSFKTFRRRARVAYAANMLLTTDQPLDDIASRAGFADASHLHRSFLQEYGCTPGQYRKQQMSVGPSGRVGQPPDPPLRRPGRKTAGARP